MEQRHEIHVIGGGLAGLAAALAARTGHPVVVHETRNRLGGRASTDERDGFRFDHRLRSARLRREVYGHAAPPARLGARPAHRGRLDRRHRARTPGCAGRRPTGRRSSRRRRG